MKERFPQPQENWFERRLEIRVELVLNEMNLDVLDDIFQAEQRRSGVEPTSNKDIQIQSKLNTGLLGYWDSDEKVVALDAMEVHKAQWDEAEDKKYHFEEILVSTMIHEFSHAAAHNSYTSHNWRDRIKSLYTDSEVFDKNGYSYDVLSKGRVNARFNFFNEAVTDSIAEDVYNEYKRRCGGDMLKDDFHPAYLPQRALLESFLLCTSEVVGIEKETIWNAIKQGYFSGLDLDSNELGKLYSELLLTNIKDIEKIPSLIQQLLIHTRDVVSEEVREKIRMGMDEIRMTAADKANN
jgi:hypothetical protein